MSRPGCTRLKSWLDALRDPSRRVYSPVAYTFGALLPGRREGEGPVAWLRGRPRPELRPGRGGIELGHVGLYPGVKIHCLGEGRVTIGSGSYLNRHTRVTAGRSVRIGRDTMISWDVVITDAPCGGPVGDETSFLPVEIGDRVWIAGRAVILGGTRLGTGCIVAAGSVVQGVFEAGTVLAGEPAEVTA